jgi:hypothetical protein
MVSDDEETNEAQRNLPLLRNSAYLIANVGTAKPTPILPVDTDERQ